MGVSGLLCFMVGYALLRKVLEQMLSCEVRFRWRERTLWHHFQSLSGIGGIVLLEVISQTLVWLT